MRKHFAQLWVLGIWLSFVVPIFGTAAADTWATMEAMPTLRWLVADASAGGNDIFVFAGTDNSQMNTAEKYDISADVWLSVTPHPMSINGARALNVDDVIYVCGGATGTTPVSKWHKYTISSDTWVTMANDLPVAVWSGALGKFSDDLIYTGGYFTLPAIGISGSTQAYDMISGTWAYGDPMPTPRYAVAFSMGADALFVAGGCIAATCPAAVVVVESFSYPTGGWTTKTEVPTARINGMMATHNSEALFFVGGNPMTTVVERYTIATDAWSQLSGMPTARGASALVIVGLLMHAIGGHTTPTGTVGTTSHEVYTIALEPAGASSDPHLRGFYGHLFSLECPRSAVYNLITTKDLQINALLDHPPGAPPGWTMVITHIGIKVRSGKDDLWFMVMSDGKVDTDAKPIHQEQTGDTIQFLFQDVLLTAGVGVRFTTHTHSFQVFPQHLPIYNGTFDYLDFLMHAAWKAGTFLDGILGQTANNNIQWPMGSLHKEVTNPWDYLQGELSDYEIPDGSLFGNPRRFNLYSAGHSANDLYLAGQSASDLYSAGQSASDLYLAGQSASDLYLAGQSASDLYLAGQSASDLYLAGQSTSDIYSSN